MALVITALLAATSVAGTQASDSQSVQIRARATPVVLDGDTVLLIYERPGAFTAAERSAVISARLRRIAQDPYSARDSVYVVVGDASSDVMTGDIVVLTVTDADALAAGVTRDSLAVGYAGAVRQALTERTISEHARTIAIGIVFALLVTIATIVSFKIVQRIFGRAIRAADEGRERWTAVLRIQGHELVPAARVAQGVHGLLRALRFITLAVLIYVSVPLILSLFPWTRGYANQLFGYILTPFATLWSGMLAYLPNFFTIGAIIVITWYLLKLIRMVFLAIESGHLTFSGFYPEWALPTYALVRVLVFAFAFIMAWPYIPGSDSPAFQGVGVMLGLLVSFGSASAIGNAVGGVVLTYMRPFRVGDRVRIADAMGDVLEKTLLVTRLRTTKNVDITIPNALVLGNQIINFSSMAAEGALVLHTTVTIGYDVPWRQVHDLLIAAAASTEGVLPEPVPFVLQTSLDDFYVSYELNVHSDQANRMARVYSELHANIQDRFNEAGVEIMSPHYRAARDGNETTIPAAHRPPGYEAPGFVVRTRTRQDT